MATQQVEHELSLGHELHGTQVARVVRLTQMHPAHMALLLREEVEALGAVLALERLQLPVLRLPVVGRERTSLTPCTSTQKLEYACPVYFASKHLAEHRLL